MSDEQSNQRSGTGRKIARGTGKVVFLPFRTGWKSLKLAKDQGVNTYRYGKSAFSDAGDQIRDNWQQSGKKGRNDQFADIFGGTDGFELLQMNLRRFLMKKRAALVLMALFVAYGAVCVFAFKAFSALLGMVGAILLGLTFAIESQFRLWQLRTHRLSQEERGSFTDFLREADAWQILNPELKEPLLAIYNAPWKLIRKLRGGHRHGS